MVVKSSFQRNLINIMGNMLKKLRDREKNNRSKENIISERRIKTRKMATAEGSMII